MRVLGSPANKLFSLHELPSVARYTPWTKAVSTRYESIQAGRLSCGGPGRQCKQFGPRDSSQSRERSPVLTPFREGRSRDYCDVRSGRFPDHFSSIVTSRQAKRRSVQNGAAHPWPRWTLESTPPNAKPIVPYCPRHPVLLWVASHRITCSQPQCATATLGFVPVCCREIVTANAQALGAA